MLNSCIEQLIFPITLFAAELIYKESLKPKKYCAIIYLCGLLLCAAFSIGWYYVPDLFLGNIENSTLYSSFAFIFSYALSAIENLVFLTISLFTLRLAFKDKWLNILFVLTAAYSTQCIAQGLLKFIMTFFNEVRIIEAIIAHPCFVLMFLLYIPVYLGCYILFAKKYRDSIDYLDSKVITVFVAIIFVSVVIGSVNIPHSQEAKPVFLFLMISLLCCSVLILVSQYHIFIWYNQKVDNIRQEYIIREQQKSYEKIRNDIEIVGIKTHDLKHIISELRSGGGTFPLREEELCELERIVESCSVIYNTGNQALDVIITEKARLCAQEGIEFTVFADGSLIKYMSNSDIYSLFCNAIDNAVEANRKLSHEDNRYIVVKLFKEEDSVNIVVENSMDGMVNFKDGLPVTSKDDTQWHGFGTRSIKQISEKYGGSIEFYCETNIFFLKIFLPSEREPSTKK